LLANVFLKSLRDQRRSLCWWLVGVAALSIFTVLFYPSIADDPAFDEMLERLPEALSRAMLGDVKDLTSPEGYLNSQLFVFMIPLVLMVFTVGKGTGGIAGEEEKGTLELLLSYPISRWRLVVDKFLAMGVAAGGSHIQRRLAQYGVWHLRPGPRLRHWKTEYEHRDNRRIGHRGLSVERHGSVSGRSGAIPKVLTFLLLQQR